MTQSVGAHVTLLHWEPRSDDNATHMDAFPLNDVADEFGLLKGCWGRQNSSHGRAWSLMIMKIGVVGAGALGGFYGAKLAHAGFDVHFLLRRDYSVVKTNGLIIKSPDGDFTERVACYQRPEEIGPCDLVIIGLKTTDNAQYQPLIAPLVRHDDTMILTLQNGMGNEEQLAALFGEEKILGGVAFLCSNRIAPGVIQHAAFGQIQLAEFAGIVRERTRQIAAMFEKSGISCMVVDSLQAIRWEKSVWNVPFNGLSVSVARGNRGATVADLLANLAMETEVRVLMREIIAAAKAEGCSLDDRLEETMIARSRTMGAYKSSMQMDYENERPLEIEAIIGEPARRARIANVSTPHLQKLYQRLREIEQQRRL